MGKFTTAIAVSILIISALSGSIGWTIGQIGSSSSKAAKEEADKRARKAENELDQTKKRRSLFVRSGMEFPEIATQDALIRWNLEGVENPKEWKEVKVQ